MNKNTTEHRLQALERELKFAAAQLAAAQLMLDAVVRHHPNRELLKKTFEQAFDTFHEQLLSEPSDPSSPITHEKAQMFERVSRFWFLLLEADFPANDA